MLDVGKFVENDSKEEKKAEKKAKKTAPKAENTADTNENNDSKINEEKTAEKKIENVEKNLANDQKNDQNADEKNDFGDDDGDDDDDSDDDDGWDDGDDDDDLSDGDDDLGGSDSDGSDDDDDGDNPPDLDDDEDIPEGNDPTAGFKKPPSQESEKIPVTEIVQPPRKTGKMIEKLGKAGLQRIDVIKAQMCSNFSGQHMAEYLSDAEMLDLLYEAIKEWLDSLEGKPLTPFGQMISALLMWTVPSFGYALWHKYTIPQTTPQIKEETEQAGGKTSTNSTKTVEDYSHLKEYQDKRKTFGLNKEKGFYNTSPIGTYIKAEFSSEQPSPIILEWINQGLSNKEIRDKLYGSN